MAGFAAGASRRDQQQSMYTAAALQVHVILSALHLVSGNGPVGVAKTRVTTCLPA